MMILWIFSTAISYQLVVLSVLEIIFRYLIRASYIQEKRLSTVSSTWLHNFLTAWLLSQGRSREAFTTAGCYEKGTGLPPCETYRCSPKEGTMWCSEMLDSRPLRTFKPRSKATVVTCCTISEPTTLSCQELEFTSKLNSQQTPASFLHCASRMAWKFIHTACQPEWVFGKNPHY